MRKVDSHELIKAVKELAIQLNRCPMYREFQVSYRGATHHIRKNFGTWTALIHAAGLEESRLKPEKITNAIFEKDIEKHLESYEPPEFIPPTFPSCAIISDIHWPFSMKRVLDRFIDYCERHQPEWIIINGDAWDMYSKARFPRSHNVFTPREEERLSRKMNEEFWADIRKKCPNSKCVQMLGNHDVRPIKLVLEAVPTMEDWITSHFEKLFTFEGVKTIFDIRQELYLNESTIVFHGHKTQLGAHRDYTLMNCFNGHTHRGGVVIRQIRGQTLFEANSGYAGDPAAKGLTYTPQKITDWTHGFLVCDEYGPRFVAA